jgi:hypothetical protein
MQKDYKITQDYIISLKKKHNTLINDTIIMIDHYVNNFTEYLAEKENIHRNENDTKVIIEYPEPILLQGFTITKIVVSNMPEGKLGLCETTYIEILVKESTEKHYLNTLSVNLLIELLDIFRLHVVNRDIYMKNYLEYDISLQKKDKKTDPGTTQLKTIIGLL